MPDRDHLFDDDVPADAGAPGHDVPTRPFAQYLRETPAAPLSQMTKLALWGAGVLTVLLFLGSLLKMAN